MKIRSRKNGSILLMVVFVAALLSAVVMGMLEINTEEVQLMQNGVYAAESLAVAEAGLNDALAQIRQDRTWAAGISNAPFAGGHYSVQVTGTLPSRTIVADGTSAHGYTARVAADVTISGGSPSVIRINHLRINEAN